MYIILLEKQLKGFKMTQLENLTDEYTLLIDLDGMMQILYIIKKLLVK
jgi:hypothetical protein